MKKLNLLKPNPTITLSKIYESFTKEIHWYSLASLKSASFSDGLAKAQEKDKRRT